MEMAGVSTFQFKSYSMFGPHVPLMCIVWKAASLDDIIKNDRLLSIYFKVALVQLFHGVE